jgi:16S rRNA (cytidine1402-2'-O)-methyltransferase
MSGTLFVVATPIGNLEDITFRAIRVLREADLIAAEDTRRTAKLLMHYGITTPTLSFHQHNTRTRLPQIMRRLEQNGCVALVSDAGTPGLADPGVELVAACHKQGIRVDPVPGPNAALAAATAAGFPLDPLTIFGFVPIRGKTRAAWMQRAQAIPHTFTFFEAPHRIRITLAELARYLGIRQIVVGRELTKVHQQMITGEAATIVGQLTDIKGEFTVVVGPGAVTQPEPAVASDLDIFNEFGRSVKLEAGTRRQAVIQIARKYQRTPKEVYAIIERIETSGV